MTSAEMVVVGMKHIVCFSGGHSSAIAAVEVVRKFGAEDTILLNHDLCPRTEDADIKRFKKEVSDYLGVPITYANMPGWDVKDQFDVCMEIKAFKAGAQSTAFCTNRLKTEPFDTEDSLFVKLFRERGYTVIATHIANGQDFFEVDPPKCGYIISNPPYSLKGEVFDRLFRLNIPFAMLVGVVGLFESQKRFEMFRDHDFEIMYLNRRVSYFKSYDDQKPSLNPPFSSVYVCKGMPQTNCL